MDYAEFCVLSHKLRHQFRIEVYADCRYLNETIVKYANSKDIEVIEVWGYIDLCVVLRT